MKRIIAKAGDLVKRHRDHLWQGIVLALVAWSAYNLGIIGAQHGATPAQDAALFQPRDSIVSQTSKTVKGTPLPTPDHSDQRVVASKSSSSKKYHYTWCTGFKQIKDSNRLWFTSAAAAEAAGYALAGNCTP